MFLIGASAKAQLSPLGSNFYQNQYLDNPAMAGFLDGLNVNIGYNRQWSDVPGSPAVQFITATHRAKKVGLGLNLYADKTGLLKRTRLMGTYSYHIMMNEKNDQLHFGLSLGAFKEQLNADEINGTITDASVMRFNERDAIFDGDFGMAYTTKRITMQVALPNLKNFLKKERYNSANWNTFYSAISYKFMTDSSKRAFTIEPKVSFRGVRGYDNIVDGGVNVSLASNRLNASVVYHSTQSLTFGVGMNYKELAILALYTSGTSALKGYSNGNFEIGIGYKFL